MKHILSLVLLFSVLSCNHDDPGANGPDLTSGNVSFTFNVSGFCCGAGNTYYVVISDTTGNVIQWAKLDNAVKKDFPYPPDSKLANVTIIEDHNNGDGTHYIGVSLYTNVPGGAYNYTYKPTDDNRVPKGQYKAIVNIGNYGVAGAEVTGDAEFLSEENNGVTETYTWGLFDAPKYNLFMQLSQQVSPSVNEYIYRHVYKEDVKAGETFTISETDFETYPLTPSHNVTYPEASDLTGTWATVTGVFPNGGTSDLFTDFFNSSEQVALTYPDIANLFPMYRSSVSASDVKGATYTSVITATTPTTTFSNLQASLSAARDISTKRIEADVTGQGDIIDIGKSFDLSNNNYLDLDVYTPMTTKIRINLPQFPNELITFVPNLAIIKDKDFEYLDFIKYNSSYNDIINARLNGTATFPNFIQAKTYDVSTSGGRMTVDLKTVTERLLRQGSHYHGK
jgi:hypothetical protein